MVRHAWRQCNHVDHLERVYACRMVSYVCTHGKIKEILPQLLHLDMDRMYAMLPQIIFFQEQEMRNDSHL